MARQQSDAASAIGFLRVQQLDDGSYVGGILVANQMGRPLEFQCTTPVKPNRTQVILYGPTLEPFVYSELIGKTLVARLDNKPQLIVVDQPPLLELRPLISATVAQLFDPQAEGSSLLDETRLQLGQHHLKFHADCPHDRDDAAERLATLPSDADLSEPLERVCEALRETLRSSAVA